MGLNLEEGGGGDVVQYRGGRSALLGKKGGAPLPMPLGKKRGAPRGRTSGCHCRWGRRGECHGLLARAPPRLPLPLPMLEKKGGALLPMGKKRGV
jgi:hypothetical protein